MVTLSPQVLEPLKYEYCGQTRQSTMGSETVLAVHLIYIRSRSYDNNAHGTERAKLWKK
jgi:hypothetical protein